MSEYTPNTENVRLGYAYRPNLPEGERHHPPLLAEFDRWIAEHDAALLESEARSGYFGTTAQSRLLLRAAEIREEARK